MLRSPPTTLGQRAAWLPPHSASGGALRALAAPLSTRSLRTAPRLRLPQATEPGESVATAAVQASDVPPTTTSEASAAPPPPSTSTSTSSSTLTPLRLTLETREARQTLRFAEIWDGEVPAIVVTAVASSSTAAEFGVVAGSRLVSLPHPTRKGEKWELKPGSAPLSRIKDLIRVYRGVLIDMEFSRDPISDEAIGAWVREQEERKEKKEEAERPSSTSPSSAAAAAAFNPSTTLMTSSYDSDGNGVSYSPAAAAAEREARALERRLRLRADRLAIDDARDDTKVVVGAAIAFLLPAAVILAIAYFSGYLDTMQANLT